ncbi:MAG: hypothetical protein JWO44_1552 [Bacteroidetes bacterium]|nr:hypothetical protein [Bacteroidota bacterium]
MLVSVIIPCYNVEGYIEECIASVLSQSHPETEIICVDNNSVDRTVAILDEQALKHPGKVRALKELKKGASAARNKGLSAAAGEWIQFLDADDLLLPEKIKHQLGIISTNRDIAFIAAACIKQTVDGKQAPLHLNITDPFKSLYTTKLGNTCANIFNAEKLKSIGGWNEAIRSSQESDLMFRLLKKDYRIADDNEPLTVIRERASGQISQGDPKKNWMQYIALRVEIINYLKASRTAYFEKEKGFYYQNLFSQLRTLAKYDLENAALIFKDNFEKDFVPSAGAGFSPYALLYRMFGFKGAERMKGMFSKLKP